VPYLNETVDSAGKYYHSNIQFNSSIYPDTFNEDIDLGNNFVEVTDDNSMVAGLNSNLCENILSFETAAVK
jgi:hypothetical protein